MAPIIIVTSYLGAMLNYIIPTLVVLILLTLTIIIISIYAIHKAIDMHRKETKEKLREMTEE
jgi:uncharacterized membrane protein YfcA